MLSIGAGAAAEGDGLHRTTWVRNLIAERRKRRTSKICKGQKNFERAAVSDYQSSEKTCRYPRWARLENVSSQLKVLAQPQSRVPTVYGVEPAPGK